VRPPVVAQPVTPRTSAVLHLDPEPILADLGAQGERAAVPGETVQDGVGSELRGDQDRLDGRVVVITVPPAIGQPYDDHGGQPDPEAYPSLPAILDVVDRTGSSMYRDGLIPAALAHAKAAYPIGVGTDVLRLVARRRLGLDPPHGEQ